MSRILAFFYGVVCYVIFLCTFVYAIGFVANVLVRKSIDSPPAAPLGQALLVDAVLLGIFAVQHSVMARQRFKRAWKRIVPPSIERSSFVLFASLALLLLFMKWEPMGGVVWNVDKPAARMTLQGLSLAGGVIALISTFLIDHFDLFGLRQVYLHLKGGEYTPVSFKTPAIYNYVRHPLYFGLVLAFWATPAMTVAHLVFALAMTAYILIGIQLEERDLLHLHGGAYQAYRNQVSMLFPWLPKKKSLQAGPSTQRG
jgi:protein-S-isoprenylcysteine O-methyltransferase Ste14